MNDSELHGQLKLSLTVYSLMVRISLCRDNEFPSICPLFALRICISRCIEVRSKLGKMSFKIASLALFTSTIWVYNPKSFLKGMSMVSQGKKKENARLLKEEFNGVSGGQCTGNHIPDCSVNHLCHLPGGVRTVGELLCSGSSCRKRVILHEWDTGRWGVGADKTTSESQCPSYWPTTGDLPDHSYQEHFPGP